MRAAGPSYRNVLLPGSGPIPSNQPDRGPRGPRTPWPWPRPGARGAETLWQPQGPCAARAHDAPRVVRTAAMAEEPRRRPGQGTRPGGAHVQGAEVPLALPGGGAAPGARPGAEQPGCAQPRPDRRGPAHELEPAAAEQPAAPRQAPGESPRPCRPAEQPERQGRRPGWGKALQPPPPARASGERRAPGGSSGEPSAPRLAGLPILHPEVTPAAGHGHPLPRCPACGRLGPFQWVRTAGLRALGWPAEWALSARGGAAHPGGPDRPCPRPGSGPVPHRRAPAAGLRATPGASGSSSRVPTVPGSPGPCSAGPLEQLGPGSRRPPTARPTWSCSLGWEEGAPGPPRGKRRLPRDSREPGWPRRLSGKQAACVVAGGHAGDPGWGLPCP